MNFLFENKTLTLAKAKYPNGRTAIVIIDAEGELHTRLTVNLPEEYLEPDEILVKNWAENEKIALHILRLNIFQATTMSIKNASSMVPIWRIADQKAFNSIPDIKIATRLIANATRSNKK